MMKVNLPATHLAIAISLNNVGSTYGELDDHAEALKYQLESLEIMKVTLSATHPAIATSLNKVGATYGSLGDHAQALKYLLESLEMRKVIENQKEEYKLGIDSENTKGAAALAESNVDEKTVPLVGEQDANGLESNAFIE